MIVLAYVDVRPLLFAAGLPAFVLLSLLVCWLVRARAGKGKVVLVSSVLFSVLFTFFLTGVGPFINQKETREYLMTWEVKPSPSSGMKESEVVLSFVDFPDHFLGEYSNELADHLRANGDDKVKVVIEVTSDYGKVRGFRVTEIAALKTWRSEWGYAGTRGSPDKSPWD
jgi:hypothetical protein